MEYCRSPNQDERPKGNLVDMVVLHYTGMKNGEMAVERLCNPLAEVSAHYIVFEDGHLIQLVSEDRRAWHAGSAFWRGNTDINERSIGIEIVNPGHEFGLTKFPDKQMAALESLIIEIIQRYSISGHNIVGHSDVAPRRKIDPGELFDWRRLYKSGIGIWPNPSVVDSIDNVRAEMLFSQFGYETVDMKKTIEAFQRHFRPREVTGILDRETSQLLSGLC